MEIGEATKLVSIASSSILALSAVFVVGAVWFRKNIDKFALLAAVTVIIIAAVSQAFATYLSVHSLGEVIVEVDPDPKDFGTQLQANGVDLPSADELETTVRVWTSSTLQCRGGGKEKSELKNCPTLSTPLELSQPNEEIFISVRGTLKKIHDELAKLRATSFSLSAELNKTPHASANPKSTDLPVLAEP